MKTTLNECIELLMLGSAPLGWVGGVVGEEGEALEGLF